MMQVDLSSPESVSQFVERSFVSDQKRLTHIQAVAASVRQSVIDLNHSGYTPGIDTAEAYCAALLHDIGYVEDLALTGFHPVDGAVFLRSSGYPRLAELIIGHSNSPEQAQLRGISGVAASADIIAELITYWDVQTKQGGEQVTYEERLADIIKRYGEESAVTQAHLISRPRIQQIINKIDGLLARTSQPESKVDKTRATVLNDQDM